MWVLVGMSVREVEARGQLLAYAAAAGTEAVASVAFLQQGDPSLSRELTRLADAGAERIDLVGVSFGTLAPAASWLRRIAAQWWRERAEPRPPITVAARLLTDLDTTLGDLVPAVQPITGAEAGLTSAAWEEVPARRHQVLICRGPRCTALGSDASAEALILETMRHGLGDDDVLITHTGCHFPCNQAPVMSIQPDDVWYGHVVPDTARAIVAEHLVAGRPLEQHRLPRRQR